MNKPRRVEVIKAMLIQEELDKQYKQAVELDSVKEERGDGAEKRHNKHGA